MKILMTLASLGIGGAETHVSELAAELHKRGHEIIITSGGGAYANYLESIGIKHYNVPLARRKIGDMIASYKMLKQIILKEKPDVVHAHARIPGFVCGLLHKKLKFRFVTTAHWVFSTAFPLKLLTNWGDRSLAVSDDIKKYLTDNYGIKDHNIRVTINGIDTEKFSDSIDYSDIAKEFGFGENKTRIIYVSRMDTDRSLAAHKLIEAAPALYKEIPDLEIVIVGGGNDFEPVKEEADATNAKLGANVIITTGPRIDINKFAASGDVFVGVSRAALEAMACKKPAVIAGNEGYIGIFDKDKLDVSIDTNFCCRGCGETTTEQLTADLLALLAPDKAMWRKELGEYSLATVKKYYSVGTMAEDAMKMYVSIIKGTPINRVTDRDFEDVDKYLICGTGKRDVDVAISGYYGFRNSGDDSILKIIIDDIRNLCPNASITVLSKRPQETAAEFGPDTVDRFDFLKLWSLFKRTKLLISGGGSLIQDVTSSKSLYYYLSVISLAKFRGARVMLYGNGIGPIIRDANKKKAAKILNKADVITLRDYESAELLKEIGVTKPVIKITADPALGLEKPQSNNGLRILEKYGLNPGEKFFCLSVRKWYDMGNTVNAFADICKMARDKYSLTPVIIPMQYTKDIDISRQVASAAGGRCLLIDEDLCAEDILSILSLSEGTVAVRLHMLIFGTLLGLPVLGIDYDPKVSSFQKFAELEPCITVEELADNRYIKKVEAFFENKDAIKQKVTDNLPDFKAAAKENANMAIELIKNER